MTPRLLVLGAGGQLGQHVMQALSGLPVTGLDRRQCDIADGQLLAACFAAVIPTIVINCAAYTRVDDAESHQEEARRVNADAAGTLAVLCAGIDAQLLHISTDYVFGGVPPHDAALGYTPADMTAPLNQYGATKLDGENAIRRELAAHWIIRTSWLFSEYGNNFARTILRRAQERDELRVVDDQVGKPTFAGHLAAACRAIVDRALTGASLDFGTYHFAGTPAVSWHGFAKTIVADAYDRGWLERRPAVIPVTMAEFPRPARRPADSRLYAADLISRLDLPVLKWSNGLTAVFRSLVPA
jgi:dTDP-4-dehydrorhamnose reductase